MRLPSMIKGWFNNSTSPEVLLYQYSQTAEQDYLIQLVEQFNHCLYHYLLTQSDPQLAQDVLQTTWLKVITKASAYQQQSKQAGASAKSWLFRIARNSLIDELRRQNRWQWQQLDDDDPLHLATVNLDNLVEQEQRLARFNQALEALPFYQKEAFVLQQEGFSLLEIAQLTDASQETIKSRLRYARKQLKQLLEL